MSWIEYTSYKYYPSNELKSINYECNVNKEIREKDVIQTCWGHRNYLQRNAEMIIAYNTKNALSPSVLNIATKSHSSNSDLKNQYLIKMKSSFITCPSIPMY